MPEEGWLPLQNGAWVYYCEASMEEVIESRPRNGRRDLVQRAGL